MDRGGRGGRREAFTKAIARWLVTACCGAALCAASLAPPGAAAAEKAIGSIRGRHHEVRILAGTPPRYTVTDREGRVLAERVTRAELARRFPAVHRALEKGLAGVQDAALR